MEDYGMEKEMLLSSEELEKTAGGDTDSQSFIFKLNIYRGSTYDSLHTVGTTADVCAGNLRLGLHASQHVSVEKIHIYHLDGMEINYNATIADNNIHEGTILKAVIDD